MDGAPDEIEYTVVGDEDRIQQQDSLTALLALYVTATDEQTTEAEALAAFDVETGEEQIQLTGRVFSTDLAHSGTVDDLRSAMEPFLAELFGRLDEQSSSAGRREALDFLSTELGIDVEKTYHRLSGDAAGQ